MDSGCSMPECLRSNKHITAQHQFPDLAPIDPPHIQPQRHPAPRTDISRQVIPGRIRPHKSCIVARKRLAANRHNSIAVMVGKEVSECRLTNQETRMVPLHLNAGLRQREGNLRKSLQPCVFHRVTANYNRVTQPSIKLRSAILAITLLAPVSAAAAPVDPLARLVGIVFSIGFGGPLGGKVCTALGITTSDQSFPVEQLSVGVPGNTRSLNVSRHRGRLDIVISHKTKDETTIYLTSEKGELEKALQENNPKTILEIPVAAADAGFQAEKAWWLEAWLPAYEAGQTASGPGGTTDKAKKPPNPGK
jgi:hypothetical protein